MNSKPFSEYQSTFSWRYASPAMRQLFGEERKYLIWRQIWVALAEAEHKLGLVSKSELDDLKKQEKNLDIDRILTLENETRHDVVAALKEFAEKAKVGGGKLHLGATSMDITDNAEMLRIKQAFQILQPRLEQLLLQFANKADQFKAVPCLGFTHLQPAEPTTIGYRLAVYSQDLFYDLDQLINLLDSLRAKGMKGAVGTGASYFALSQFAMTIESGVMEKLGLNPALISTQVYSRKLDYQVLTWIASTAASLAKFAADLRILQSPGFGEWSEPFATKQVGSSAMPFKKNPISAEKICSLARYLAALPQIALENASHSYLERTLDDSANRRIILPEAFLALDEIISTADKLISGLVLHLPKIELNLQQYAPFISAESLIIEAVKNGADRQEAHEQLRLLALQAWSAIQAGQSNPLVNLLSKSKYLNQYLSPAQIQSLLAVENHLGDAPQRVHELVKRIKNQIKVK